MKSEVGPGPPASSPTKYLRYPDPVFWVTEIMAPESWEGAEKRAQP